MERTGEAETMKDREERVKEPHGGKDMLAQRSGK